MTTKQSTTLTSDFLEESVRLERFRPSTALCYKGDLAKYQAFLERQRGCGSHPSLDTAAKNLLLLQAKEEDVRAHVEELEWEHSINTVGRHVAAIRRFYGWLIDQKRVTRNPAQRILIRKHARRSMPTITREQVAMFFEDTGSMLETHMRDRAIIEILCSHEHLRLKDLLPLTRTHCFEKEGRFHITVGDSPAQVLSLDERVSRILSQYLRIRPQTPGPTEQQPLFVSMKGGDITDRALRRRIQRRLQKIGVSVRFNLKDLRVVYKQHLQASNPSS